jgi:hypothetical protein
LSYVNNKFFNMSVKTKLALLGVTNALMGPLPTSSFPKYPTTVSPKNDELDSGNLLIDFSKIANTVAGLYRAYRNDLYVFPT